jgi:alkaline phosphatase
MRSLPNSANAMSAYATDHKTCVNAMGIYCARNKNALAHPKVETIAELAKRRNAGMAVGVVTNTEIQDATPAGMVAHVRRRSDYDEIVRMFHELSPEVMLGGGSSFFLPKSDPAGRRKDDSNYIEKFQVLGYSWATTATAMKAAAADKDTARLLGLFHPGNLDGVLDRRLLKKGTVSAYPRPARPRGPDAGGHRQSVQASERLCLAGRSGAYRQVQSCSGLGAGGLRYDYARQCGCGSQSLRRTA